MKNIHVLPTNKPSKLATHYEKMRLIQTPDMWTYEFTKQNIYITSDEKFVRDEYITDGIEVIKATPKLVNAQGLVNRRNWRKVILTTDTELIKDGVQAIDDEFLEWFVKNPSCERVEVESKVTKDGVWTDLKGYVELPTTHSIIHKIIIPKEEPKQETLEEVAERLYPYEVGYGVFDRNCEIDIERERFVEGAKWQQEQDNNKYSEEEVVKLLIKFNQEIQEVENVRGWFEEFKKK